MRFEVGYAGVLLLRWEREDENNFTTVVWRNKMHESRLSD